MCLRDGQFTDQAKRQSLPASGETALPSPMRIRNKTGTSKKSGNHRQPMISMLFESSFCRVAAGEAQGMMDVYSLVLIGKLKGLNVRIWLSDLAQTLTCTVFAKHGGSLCWRAMIRQNSWTRTSCPLLKLWLQLRQILTNTQPNLTDLHQASPYREMQLCAAGDAAFCIAVSRRVNLEADQRGA